MAIIISANLQPVVPMRMLKNFNKLVRFITSLKDFNSYWHEGELSRVNFEYGIQRVLLRCFFWLTEDKKKATKNTRLILCHDFKGKIKWPRPSFKNHHRWQKLVLWVWPWNQVKPWKLLPSRPKMHQVHLCKELIIFVELCSRKLFLLDVLVSQ